MTSPTPSPSKGSRSDGRRVSDDLNLDEIERILDALPQEGPDHQTNMPPASTDLSNRDEEEPQVFNPSRNRRAKANSSVDPDRATADSMKYEPPSKPLTTPKEDNKANTTTYHSENRENSNMESRDHSRQQTEVMSSPLEGFHKTADPPIEVMTPLAAALDEPEPPFFLPTGDEIGAHDDSQNDAPLMMLAGRGSVDVPKLGQENIPRARSEEVDTDALAAAVNRPHCLEIIYKNSCRARDGSVLDYNVLIPPLEDTACIPPSGFAIESKDVVAKHACYGVKGDTLEKQRENEIEDEKPPKSASEMPYSGGVIDVKQWNPVCLQALILLVPLVFFVVILITQYKTIITTSSKNALKTGKLLGTLSAYLVEEQAMASYIGAFTTRISASTDMKVFYADLVTARQKYTDAQTRTDDIIAQIQVEIGTNGADLERNLGGVSADSFLNSFQLATLRVRALTSSQNWDIMMRYENIIQNVLIFRGILMLKESIRTTSELKQTKNVFSTAALYVSKSLELYFKELGLGLNMKCPESLYELYYLMYAVATIRVLERTFLFPSDPSILSLLATVVTDDFTILEVRIPSDIESTIIQMLEYTYEPLYLYDYFNMTLADELTDLVTTLTSDMNELDDPLQPKIDKYRTVNDYIGLVCIIICCALACVGLLWHCVTIVIYRSSRSRYREINDAVIEMRDAVIRMHEATMKMAKLQVDDMDSEVRHLQTRKVRIYDEERDLYIGNRMTQRLEPYLPLPMVHPPPDVPEEALLYGKVFARPTLLSRKNMVGIRLNFSYLTNSNKDLASVFDAMSCTNLDMTRGSLASFDHAEGTPRKAEKRQSQSEVKEQLYFERTLQILRFVCEVSRVYMPSSEKGAYLSQCGEDAVLWVNLCEEIDHPCVIAYLIAASVSDYCERCLIETPDMVLCRGNAVLGNITSYSPHGLGLVQDGVWTNSVIFDSDYDDENGMNGDDDGHSHEVWKDFVTATEGFGIKKRFKRWLKQLLGMKPNDVVEESRQKEIVADPVLAALRKTGENDSESDYDVPVPEELAKEDRPSENANCLTSFTVYGEVAQEMEIALDVARCHSQIIVANEDFLRHLLGEREKAMDFLKDLGESTAFMILGNGKGRSSDNGSEGFPHHLVSQSDPRNNSESGRPRPHKVAPRDVALAVAARFMDHRDVATPLDILEVRRRAIVIGVEQVMTNKEKRRKERQEQKEHDNMNGTNRSGMNGTGEFKPNLDENDSDDEDIPDFKPYNRIVDVSAPVTTVHGNQATTSKLQGDLHVYYALELTRDGPGYDTAFRSTGSRPTSRSSVRRGPTDSNACLAWRSFMEAYMEVCYDAEAQSPASGTLRSGSKAEMMKKVGQCQELLRNFVISYPVSSYANFSARRMMDVLRSIQIMCESSEPLPPGLQMLIPCSLEALRIYRLHTFFSAQS